MIRLGASAYLSHAGLAAPTFAAAAANGATIAFTSLHIPEDDPATARATAGSIAAAARDAGLALVADVSPRIAGLLGDEPWTLLRDLGVARVRIDAGFDVEQMRAIASVLPLALNASTLRPGEAEAFRGTDVELIHNYYPRQWTGLSSSAVAASVSSARSFGWRVGAFIAGDAERRAPLAEGLPTLEAHRELPPPVQAVDLAELGVDDLYVGDPALTSRSWSRLGTFVRDDVVVVDAVLAPGVSAELREALAAPDHERPDAAEAMIRFQHSRQRLAHLTPDVGGQPRPAGSITLQLASAGRYRGELAVTLRDLPPDERVAVIGTVVGPAPAPGGGHHYAFDLG